MENAAPITIRALKEMVPTLPDVIIEKKEGQVVCFARGGTEWMISGVNGPELICGKGENKTQAIMNFFSLLKTHKPESFE